MVKESLSKLGKEISYASIHWRGGEEDTTIKKEIIEQYLKETYDDIFNGFCNSFGKRIPIILHRIVCKERCQFLGGSDAVESMEYINSIFDELANENNNISVFDVTEAPHYHNDNETHGIFIEDNVHFTPKTNKWVAEKILKEYIKHN